MDPLRGDNASTTTTRHPSLTRPSPVSHTEPNANGARERGKTGHMQMPCENSSSPHFCPVRPSLSPLLCVSEHNDSPPQATTTARQSTRPRTPTRAARAHTPLRGERQRGHTACARNDGTAAIRPRTRNDDNVAQSPHASDDAATHTPLCEQRRRGHTQPRARKDDGAATTHPRER